MKKTTILPVPAILLAAGISARLGAGNKLLLPLGGVSVIRRTCRNILASRVSELIVVTGFEHRKVARELEGLPVRICRNPDYREGMAASIRVGKTALPAGASGVLILLADQPNLQPETINKFIRRFRRGDKKIIAAELNGQIRNPALFAADFFPKLTQLRGKEGARKLLKKYHDEITAISVPAEQLIDIDTREDYERLKAITEDTR